MQNICKSVYCFQLLYSFARKLVWGSFVLFKLFIIAIILDLNLYNRIYIYNDDINNRKKCTLIFNIKDFHLIFVDIQLLCHAS